MEAALNKRSTTAEIIERLDRSFVDRVLPPKFIVRLEVLREGPSIEIPVLEFFQAMSNVMRTQIQERKTEHRERRRREREDAKAEEDVTLDPAVDWAEGDAEAVAKAAQEVADQRAARMRRAAAKRKVADDDKPDE